MPTLHKPALHIKLNPDNTTADVTVTVQVDFDPNEVQFIKTFGVNLKLSCELRGSDDDPNPDDDLYWFSSKSISKSNVHASHTYTFSKGGMSRSVLDEDSWPQGDDEVYARCKLKSQSSLFSYSKSLDSSNVSGSF
jgi:hypothetical protein